MALDIGRRGLAVIALVAAGMVLTGCSVISDILPQPSQPDATTQPVAAGSESDGSSLAVGDCLNDSVDNAFARVRTVPCSQEHDYEVFDEFEIPGDEYPDDDAVVAAVEEGCGSRFESFAGIPYDSSELDYRYVTPVEQGRAGQARHIAFCLIGDPAGAVTGTLAGAAR